MLCFSLILTWQPYWYPHVSSSHRHQEASFSHALSSGTVMTRMSRHAIAFRIRLLRSTRKGCYKATLWCQTWQAGKFPFKCKVFNGEKHINNKGFSITTFDYRIILSFVDGCCTKCGWPIWDGFLGITQMFDQKNTGTIPCRKTTCSPQTRMLTRMLMAQMSKHMDTHFSPVTIPMQRRLWNMEESGVQSVECGV